MKIETADVFIGVFNRRIGTPVVGSESGTIHELKQAIRAWKQTGAPHIKLFFRSCNAAEILSLDGEEKSQYKMLMKLKKEIQSLALYFEFRSKEEFIIRLQEEFYRYRISIMPDLNQTFDSNSFYRGTNNLKFRKVVAKNYNPIDNKVNIEISEYLSFLATIRVAKKGQILRIYFQFETDKGEERWVGFTNLFPSEYITEKEHTIGINFSLRRGYILNENVLEVIKKYFPDLAGKPIRIIKVRCRGDFDIHQDIHYFYSFAEPVTVGNYPDR